MTTELNGIHDDAPAIAAAPAKRIRPLYWSLRRELWEHRSLYVAPLVIAGILLFIFFVQLFWLPARVHALSTAEPLKRYHGLSRPYDTAAGMIMMAGVLTGFFYCVDALHGERRDRSMLFWKSLPVSDRTTVLSKFMIPIVVLPLIVWTIVVATQLILIVTSTAVLQADRGAVALLWSNVKIHQRLLAGLWGLVAMALWHAPIYAWLLLISGWAKRAPFLWAGLPVAVLMAIENSAPIPTDSKIVRYRLIGWFREAFILPTSNNEVVMEPLANVRFLHYLSTPGLWIGLLFAAVIVAATIRMRRDRDPI